MPPRASRLSGNALAKVKQETRVKQEKQLPSKGKGKQRAADSDEEEAGVYHNSEQEQDNVAADHPESGEEESTSPRGRKRARADASGNAHQTDRIATPVRQRVATLPRDTDGFIPGSIVRIQLENFVTYDYVQFRTGPHLNMILGPNGTGKSTIACAIAIGLNWPPSILGRASDLRSFVKQDKESGYVEVELKGPKGKGNLVIRRKLTAASNSSSFTLNGQPATGKEIAAKMLELNVQVGNLCSFLPQDRVSEFAAMTPQQLLRETERAAGDERLTSWHETLIAAGRDLKQMEESIKGEAEQLKQKQARNEGIRRDVERFKEREHIQNNIALLNILVPVEKYRQLRKAFLEIKQQQRDLHRRVNELKKKNAPAHDLLKTMEQDLSVLNKKRETAKLSTQTKFKKMSDKWNKSEALDKEAEDLADSKQGLKNREKDRVKKIKSLDDDIIKCEDMLAAPPPKDSEEALVAEHRRLTTERSTVILRKEELEGQVKSNIDTKARYLSQLNTAQDELRKLDDEKHRRLRTMHTWDKAVHDAIVWLRDNKDKFKMEVFEPPYMCLTIPDRRYVDALEACFNPIQLKTFVAQCQEDLDTFNHYINDTTIALGRKARVASWFRPVSQNSLVQAPMDIDELKDIGFDGYAIDYVDCPEGLRWFLTNQLNLHRTAISLNGSIDVNRAMDAVTRTFPNGGGGANFINGKTLNIVARSRYGKRAIGNVTREIRPARNLVASSIDPEVKQRIHDQIVDTSAWISTIEDERAVIDEKLKAVLSEDSDLVNALNAIKARRDALRRARERQLQLQTKLKNDKSQKQELLNAKPIDEEQRNLNQALREVNKARIRVAKDLTEISHSVLQEQAEATQIGLQYIQLQANRNALQELCDRKDKKFQDAMLEFNKANEAYTRIKSQSHAIVEETKAILNTSDEEIRSEYERISKARIEYEEELAQTTENGVTPPSDEGIDLRSLEELETELGTQNALLDMNFHTNAGIVEQYDNRQREIESLTRTIKEQQIKAARVEHNIKNARDNWKPALEKLVGSIGEKFSAAFDRIGCAGEIRISEHEDFDKWAIDILVKFRDSEKLQLLTAQRQSGGERSLTTILYLMSLTEEARAPFSLVDEINQGMDQRAERMVHNSMVDVTCKPDSAQYFLITPKLLPDLKYHERMRILCVNNGEWLPEDKNLGNMMSMIEGYVQRNRAASAM